MSAQGSAHVTADVDISYDRSPTNIESIVNVLQSCHARLRNVPADLPFILDARTFNNVFNLTLTTDVGDLDLLAEPDGVDSFEGLWERSNEMEIFGKSVHVASLDDLIAMKRAAGRPKDKQHILELEDLQQYLLDEAKQAQS